MADSKYKSNWNWLFQFSEVPTPAVLVPINPLTTNVSHHIGTDSI